MSGIFQEPCGHYPTIFLSRTFITFSFLSCTLLMCLLISCQYLKLMWCHSMWWCNWVDEIPWTLTACRWAHWQPSWWHILSRRCGRSGGSGASAGLPRGKTCARGRVIWVAVVTGERSWRPLGTDIKMGFEVLHGGGLVQAGTAHHGAAAACLHLVIFLHMYLYQERNRAL